MRTFVIIIDEIRPEYRKPTASHGIMDTTNGHDKGLVERINAAWDKDKEKFRPILVALYDRDLREICNADSFQVPEWEKLDESQIFCELQNNWDLHAWNYLQHIADDGDLESILAFVRG